MSPFKYFGGKGLLARWIVSFLPRGKIYVEPFCGAASVFWHLPAPYPIEVLNDLDGDIVNVFRVLQDPQKFKLLAHKLTWTPYSLAEMMKANEVVFGDCEDPVERAWGVIVLANFSVAHSLDAPSLERRWGRDLLHIDNGMAGGCNDWRKRLTLLDFWHERLTRVQIDNRPALEVIRYWDTEETVFYLDPPYPHQTRKGGGYRCEMTDEDHYELIDTLLTLEGKVVLSTYPSPIYDRLKGHGLSLIHI